MLQKAASNAYSWWWASHIRTRQSKWLEHNLQDMEVKVTSVLKLIEEDGDSFAKRAEMYYKNRPELIRFVEEAYRAYRALAERYDHLSTELQNANNTIASVCPDQLQFSMDNDDEYSSPSFLNKSQENLKGSIPMVPKLPVDDLKGLITADSKKMQHKKSTKDATIAVAKSRLIKAEGIEEIGRLHKRVLALQTEKEFAKSCYESGLAKYWEIDNEITQMQGKICSLEVEFGEARAIEDDEARNVMAATALKSCKETLVRLQEKQERSVMETKVEQKRIEDAREKLVVLKNEFVLNEFGPENPLAGEDEEYEGTKKMDKMKEKFEVDLGESLSVAEMEDKIDELVNKVLNLETAVSSQSALIGRLRVETDEFESQIQALEVDKCRLIDGNSHLMNKLREMEEKLHWIQDLNQCVEDRNNDLQTHFTEARYTMDRLSEKMHNIKIHEVESSEIKINDCDKMSKKVNASQEFVVADASERENSPAEVKSISKLESEEQNSRNQHASDGCGILQSAKPETAAVSGPSQKVEDTLASANESSVIHETSKPSEKSEDRITVQASSMTVRTLAEVESKEHERGPEDEPDWKQLFLKGMDNREKNLLMEYTTILRNYKDTKKKLMEVETNNQNSLSDILLQLKELENSNAMKEEEILSLRRELNLSRTSLSQNNNTDQYAEPRISTEKSMMVETSLVSPSKEEVKEDIGVILSSEIEEKFRMNIDELLNENLDVWFRFNTAVQEVPKFKNGVKDLQAKILILDERKKQDGKATVKSSLISDVRPLYKHLTEVQTELNSWVERSLLLKDELKNRFSSLCNIQEEVTKELKASAADGEFRFASHQAAKFQGEILNMKQENNKVAEELQAGLDDARTLQLEVERTLLKLTEDWELSGSQINRSGQQQDSDTQNRVPLWTFIFGAKPKKQKTSIFACVHPALHRRYTSLRSLYSSK